MHKYKPKTINDIFFHKDIYERLAKMSKDNSIPHIIFHGPVGSGKRTMTNVFLRMIYGNSIDNIHERTEEISGSGSKTKTETFKVSDHHIVINPTGNNFDRYIVHQVIKQYANTQTIELALNPNSKFRTIQISNLDKLSHNAQTSLRRMIETNASTCRFIMWCNNLSNVILPLQSRCVLIRVPRPSPKELFKYLCLVSARETQNINLKIINKIIKLSDCNIKKALWCLQTNIMGFGIKTNSDRKIKSIVKMIMEKDMAKMEDIRNAFFNLTITNFLPVDIIKQILKLLLKNKEISDKNKINIILNTSEIEYKLLRGRRDVIHFEYWITNIIKNLHDNNDQSIILDKIF
jgi:replication factor C subunit 3/5